MTEMSYIPIEARGSTYAPIDPIQYPIGTKFRWSDLYNDETYRIAIVTKKGFLQVKSVTDGGGDVDKTRSLTPGSRYPLKKRLFADELSWRTSLPNGEMHGEITITPYKAAEKPMKMIIPIRSNMTDPDKLYLLQLIYRARTVVEHLKSPSAMLDQASCSLIYYLSKGSGDIWVVKKDLDYWTEYCSNHTDEENSREPVKIHSHGSRFYLNVGDEFRTVAFDHYKGESYIVDNTGRRYKSFLELCPGLVALSVLYRNKMIPLSMHF